jgi:hypothetical protein
MSLDALRPSHDDEGVGAMARQVPVGVYEHYKGRHYLVLGVARDDSTDEQMVVYVRLYEREGPPMSVRRLEQFFEEVTTDRGESCPRFRYIGVEQ